MILRRLGNKQKVASDIIPHFPPHKIYIEPFFGAGGMFFSKPRSKYSILNDMDSDVFNLFQVVKDNMEEFVWLFSVTPMSEELFIYWYKNEETDSVKKALRFLFLSSFSYLGKADTFRLLHSDCSYKIKLANLIKECANYFSTSMFRNKDFREFFKDVYESEAHIPNKHRFIYADPPYLDTTENYSTPDWTENDVVDLFDTLESTEIKFAMSEFAHPFILDQVKKRGLNQIVIGDRLNIKNRSVEMLFTNYDNPQHILF